MHPVESNVVQDDRYSIALDCLPSAQSHQVSLVQRYSSVRSQRLPSPCAS